MHDIPMARRTALKMTGVGLAGSVLSSGSAAAKNPRWDASVILFNSNPPLPFVNITEASSTDDPTSTLETHGFVLFDKTAGADAVGGGPFSVEDDPDPPGELGSDYDGEWSANEVVRFEKYGAFPAGKGLELGGQTLPQSWKGGLVELEVEFDPQPSLVTADDTLTVECFVGTNDNDEPENDEQGVYIGGYDTVPGLGNFGTIFTYE